MSLGNLKKLQAAERLLKQGKTSEALEQLERLAKSAPNDVLTINRMGDLLARQGRTGEAIGYYFKIATHYTEGGYLPKAIAIYKKIVRLDPKSSRSLCHLGELYLRQKLPAEAQRFLGTAAQQFEEAGDQAGAKEAYGRLVEADPGNPVHRAKLAEAMVATGDNVSAMAELLNLGDTLQRGGKGLEAEKIYRRAQQLDPSSTESLLGLARALTHQGKTDDAIDQLAAALNARMESQVLTELVVLCEREGRHTETERLLRVPGATIIPESAVVDLLELAVSRGDTAEFWQRMDRVTADWTAQGHSDKVRETLERLADAEEPGHVPALQRLERQLSEAGNPSAAGRVLERLVAIHRDAGDQASAEQSLSRLRVVAPASSMLAMHDAPTVAAPAGQIPSEFEAPAVPLTRADKEFVTGRLTQAEILEKYSLLDQSLQQILEVTARFPGHVAAQQKLLLLRRTGDPASVRDTLVSLALACRAAGDAAGASSVAGEAVQLGGLDSRTEEALRRLGLLGGGEAVAAAAPVQPFRVAASAVVPPAAMVAASAGAEATEPADSRDGFLIDFDADGDDDDLPSMEPAFQATVPAPERVDNAPAAAGPVRAPGPDMLQEIRQHLQHNRANDAQHGIIALESLGYGSEELDTLAAETEALLQRPTPATIAPATDLLLDLDDPDGESATDLSGADDLVTIAAALEVDEQAPDGPLTPDAGTEQSVEEVFAAFRQAVQEEVGEDSRTHYDLAIGYKEMGLLEEAIEGFGVAARAPELAREANMMLAVCHREQGEIIKAVEHYRLAASIDCSDQELRVATRYDLAEVLIQSGDDAAALKELRQVLEMDPRYRDVRQRIDDLETRLQT